MNTSMPQEKLTEMSKEIDRIIALNHLLDPYDDVEKKLMLINIKKMENYSKFLRQNFLKSKKLKLVK